MSPDLTYWLELGAVTMLTSIVSGVMGMVGGMLLLAFMLLRFEPVVAIPVHGVVQLVANGSRAFFLRRHIDWPAVWRFVWPLLPAGALGIALLGYVPVGASRVGIGLFVLAATWLKSFFSIQASATGRRALPIGGALVGFFSSLVGATGPLLGPFILALGLGSQAMIATMAACQVVQHASKVLLFGLRGFDLPRYLLPCAALCLCAVAGSAIGTRLLDRIPQKPFRLMVKLVLTALALHQLYQGLLGLMVSSSR
ncbi:MAG TPA: sulfite exporter TauE/SafE family protein [Polyangiaceae bacterium]|nr:sulfite exporter TauE/SafE family protein [Polyangiaceae bacterium]